MEIDADREIPTLGLTDNAKTKYCSFPALSSLLASFLILQTKNEHLICWYAIKRWLKVLQVIKYIYQLNIYM